MKGYTRYGDWYGIPYGDWCAMFVSFCLHYAKVEYPNNASCTAWVKELKQQDLFKTPSDHIPKAGDIIFFNWEQDNTYDHVGLVESVEGFQVITIEGNTSNRVAKRKYDLQDKRIGGYGILTPTTVTQEPAPENGSGAWAELLPAEISVSNTVGGTNRHVGSQRAIISYASGEPLDLTPYINAVTMYDEKGNPLLSGSAVSEGDLIEFKLEYTITGQQLGYLNGDTVTVNSNTLTYSLPNVLQLVQNDSGNIYNAAGQAVGTYLIDSATGDITLTFTDSYVEQNARGIQIHGYISCFSTVTKITENDTENQDFKFTDGIVLGVVIEEKTEAIGDLIIEKQASSVNGEEITYEIKVTSTEGTKGPITITDTMVQGLTFKEGVSVRRGNGTLVSNTRFNPSADNSSFTLTLPEMAPGDSYTVRYRCQADINLLGADMTARNTATVKGKDSEDHELKDQITVDYTFNVLDKTGTLNDDGSITWTITINQAKADISGWTLDDILSNDNGSTHYSGRVTIKTASGTTVASNVQLPYTFPNGSNDTYLITYTTTHSFGEGSAIYTKAILSDSDTDVTEVTGVVLGSPITKSGEVSGDVIQTEDGTYMLPVRWTVTIDTTKGAIQGGKVFIDKLDGWPCDDLFMTYDQLMAAMEALESQVRAITGQGFANFDAAVLVSGGGNYGTTYNLNQLRNNTNGCQSFRYKRWRATLGSAGIPKGHVLTFSYDSYGLFPNNVVSTSSFVNRFSISEAYETEERVNYVEGTVKLTKYAIKYPDPTTSTGPEIPWGAIDWGGEGSVSQFTYEQLKDSYLGWSIELSVPPNYAGKENVIIYEDLPEGLTPKGLEMIFLSDQPTKPLVLETMEPGQTYTFDLTLYPADQYGQYRPQGAFPCTITIKVTEDYDLEITVPGVFFENMGDLAKLRQDADEWFGYMNIFTQINDDFKWTPREEGSHVYVHTFENRYTVVTEDGIVVDLGSQSQRITKDEREGVIRKTGTVDKGSNILSYAVILNAYGRDLIPDAGTLSVHDELTYPSTANKPLRVRLVPGSVKLYEIRLASDGSYTKLNELPFNYLYDESSTEHNGTTNWVHTIDLTIPDGKALLLEYSYKADGHQSDYHDISNACTITGEGNSLIEGDHKLEVEVKDATAQADTKGVMLYKVDSNSDGLFLEHARFNIYIWNEAQGKYIIVHHPNHGSTEFSTDASGMIVLDGSTVDLEQFAYNTAYYIVEVESPNGYYLSPEPYYFYIANDNTVAYPFSLPPDFSGHALVSGDIIYRQNVSEFTEIRVEKYWKDYNGQSITVTGDMVSGLTIELWQMLKGDPDSAKRFDTYTITPDKDGNWNFVITGLPKATKNADGTKGTDYLYYIKEVDVRGYRLESITNNDGTTAGTIKLTNRKLEGYELPKTGGIGTPIYTAAGVLLVVSSLLLLVYSHKKRRREDFNSS